MPRIKRIVPNGYTTVNNEFLRDTELSLTARGLLITMLSLPDGWNMSGRGLAAILPDGRDKVFSTLKKLEEKGYLKRERVRENGHFVDVEYQFCDCPIFLSSIKKENIEKVKKEKKSTSLKKKKELSSKKEMKIDFSSITPREERKEDVMKNLNSLIGGELEEYVKQKVLEKDKCLRELDVLESYFDVIAGTFTDVCSQCPDIRDNLSNFSAYDVAIVCERVKKKSPREIEEICKTYFTKEKPFWLF